MHINIKLPVPAPGETVEAEQDGYYIIIENTNRITEPVGPEVGEIVGYTVVEVEGNSSVVHAAAVEQKTERTRVRPYTLCDRSELRAVTRRVRNAPLRIVTCKQCQAHLTKAGAL